MLTAEQIEQRLLKIELAIRNMKVVCETQMLAIMDSDGDLCASLHVDSEGPRLTLFDKSSKPRVSLCLESGHPALRMSDLDGITRVTLVAYPAGLCLYDGNRIPRVWLYEDDNNEKGGIRFLDKDGNEMSAGKENDHADSRTD